MDYRNFTKAELIKMLELAERHEIHEVNDVSELLDKYRLEEQEYFLAITLDGAFKVIEVNEITKGLVNRTMAHPREVFRKAIEQNAVAVIIAHNHPSGNLEPSQEDIELTERMRQAGKVIGINVLDHIICGRTGDFSMKEHNTVYLG